jgi:hypothetical protein
VEGRIKSYVISLQFMIESWEGRGWGGEGVGESSRVQTGTGAGEGLRDGFVPLS